MRGFFQALRLTWQTSKVLAAGYIALTLVSAVVPVAAAWLTKALLDHIVGRTVDVSYVAGVGIALAASALISGVIPFAMQYAQKETDRRTGVLAQDRLFGATEKFVGMARFEDPEFLNQLRIALQNGGATPGLVMTTALSAGRTIIMALGFLGSLLVLSPWLPILVLASALPVLIAEIWLARRRVALQWEIGPLERREIFFRELLTNVQAAKEIRLFGTGAHLRDRMSRERRENNSKQSKMDRRELTIQSATGAVTAGLAGVALLWSVFAAVAGTISIGDVSLLIASVAGVQSSGVALMRDIGNSHRQLLLFQSYLDVVNSGPDLPVPAQPKAVPPLRKGIELRDVWFRYSPNHPWALSGINLFIAHGEAVGLVGRNGAGKSTLVKLLCRMYDPDQGVILWDGVDLRELDPAGLRQRIGGVFQDYMKYDLTAAENIELGDLQSSGDLRQIELAAANAGAHGFVSELPSGYDTMLSRIFFQGDWKKGAAGVTLSGGQWQRLAIARAYVRGERDLLILDEPSSGLDAEAEFEVHRSIQQHRAGRTSVLISHRLGAVREADTIVVIEKGKVAERGMHAELVLADGIYAHLFRTQARGYQEAMQP